MLRVIGILLWSVVIQGMIAVQTPAWAATIDGQSLFEKRCSACHKLPDPDQPPPQGWAEQLDLMAPLARLKTDQKRSVLEYLQTHSKQASMSAALDEDRELFEEKCGQCHTTNRILLSELHGDSLRHVVSRMQNRSGTDWLSDDDVQKILGYLESESREASVTVQLGNDATSADIFAARCSACHTLERVFKNLGENSDPADFWSHTVSRMRGKAPQWVSDAEADQILEYLLNSWSATDP